jgi:hypothetical protein
LTEKVRFKVVIKHSAKPLLLDTLSLFGVNYETIFPGLEGAARYADEHYFYLKGYKGDLNEWLKQEESRSKEG